MATNHSITSLHIGASSRTFWPLARRLWHEYISQHTLILLLALVLMSIEGGTLGLISYMVKPMIDEVFIGADRQAMVGIALVLFIVFMARGLCAYAQRTLTVYVGLKVVTRLQLDMTRHLLSLDSAFFRSHSPGALIERVRGDSGALQTLAANSLISIGRDGFSLLSLLSVALYIDWAWTCIAFVAAPLLVWPISVVQKRIRLAARQSRIASAKLSTRLDEIFHGYKAIKANVMQDHESKRVQRDLRGFFRQYMRSERGKAVLPTLVDLMAGLGFVGVMLYGGGQIIAGEKTLGDFMSFFAAMALVFDPVRRLTGLGGAINAATASLERIYQVFDQQPSIVDHPHATPLANPRGDIEFINVQFAYSRVATLGGMQEAQSMPTEFTTEQASDSNLIIRDISLRIPAGKITALVGESGAGKSTLFSLLCRLEQPTHGKICIGGQDISMVHIQNLRENLALVTQETNLFDESLRDNIAYGRWDADDSAISMAAREALVEAFAQSFPQGLTSPAGPRGSNLSGGQRQRVVIARAMLRDARILLLDEATSALDSRTEKRVQQALERAAKGRTTLVIAHRLSTVQKADCIFVMEKGQLVESGTHSELLAKKGVYTRLHRALEKD